MVIGFGRRIMTAVEFKTAAISVKKEHSHIPVVERQKSVMESFKNNVLKIPFYRLLLISTNSKII